MRVAVHSKKKQKKTRFDRRKRRTLVILTHSKDVSEAFTYTDNTALTHCTAYFFFPPNDIFSVFFFCASLNKKYTFMLARGLAGPYNGCVCVSVCVVKHITEFAVQIKCFGYMVEIHLHQHLVNLSSRLLPTLPPPPQAKLALAAKYSAQSSLWPFQL